jgi:HAD superfamily hydrolase (TIGR01484 family)
MQALRLWPAAQRRQVLGVFTDIDDTLTTEGAITADALQALQRLKDAGLPVVAITGRPVGWSVPFASTWPVDAIVAENGAVALVPQGEELRRLYLQDAATRARNLVRMQAVAARVLREVPDARLAQDSPGRETDIAIDHSEFTHLPRESIQRVVEILRSEGMSATVSSIHINGWFGDHDKRVGARWILQALWNRDLDQELQRWVYVGDSTNDQRMFEVFDNSVGVANIRRFLPELVHLPRFVTLAERGAGFAEVVDALLAARAEAGPA